MKKINDSERNIYPFFIITLLWTWGMGFSPVILGLQGTPLGTFLFYFGGGAPSVVGLFFVFFTYSKEKRRNYFYRCFNFKQMGLKCLFALLLFFSIIAIIGIFIGISFFHSPIPEMTFIKMLIKRPYILPLIIFISIISGPLNEEFGWRGFALDILLKKWGFWSASAILGFIWAIWHLPWYFMPGQAQYDLLQRSLFDAFLFIPSTMLFSFVVSFVYIKTNRSVLAGAITHMLSNLITSQLLAPCTVEMSTAIRYTSMFFCTAIIVYSIVSKNFKKELARIQF
jgi:membrane protease YdiL (CAAX protease family)